MNYIASWAGGDNQMGSISSNKGGFYYSGQLLQVSEKTALNSDFIWIFLMILYMRGQGQITQWGKFEASQEIIITLNICSKF